MFSLVTFLVLAILASPPVKGLSCIEGSLSRSRRDAIKDSYCRSEDVYSGKVMAATCNCLQSEGNNLLNCHYYQLDLFNSIINTTLLSRGTCEGPGGNYGQLQSCSSVGNSLVTWGLRVEGPSQSDIPTKNLTSETGDCKLSCPFNAVNEGPLQYQLQYQPCLYTVRVGEVFKGNYTMGEEIEVTGPSIISDYNRILQVYTDYVAGIGGGCNPINDWSQLSTFSSEELDQLRKDMDCGGLVFLPSTSLLLFLSSLVILLLSKG